MALPSSAVSSSTTAQLGNASTSQDPDRYHPLYLAALKGNWEAAKRFLDNDTTAATATFTRTSMTALHVAAGEGRSEFVEKMVSYLPVEALEMRDHVGFTALHYAAIAGSMRAAKALVKKKPALANGLDFKGRTPLLVASMFSYGSYDLLWYLTLVTKDEEPSRPFTGPLAMDLVLMLVLSGSVDILLYLLQRYRNLATATGTDGFSLLSLLADTPSNFLSANKLGFWESCIYSVIPVRISYEPPNSVRSIVEGAHEEGSQHLSGTCPPSIQLADQVLHLLQSLFFGTFGLITPSYIKRLRDAKHRHHCTVELFRQACAKIRDTQGNLTEYFLNRGEILEQATALGIIEIVRIVLQLCPDLIWVSAEGDKFLIHVATENRRENIFNLLCEMNVRGKMQSGRVTRSRTITHLAAKLAPFPQLSSVSGAALQMQRELKWFKEVEKLVHPYHRTSKNEEGKTAQELFTEEHKELAEAGEKWMKDTSNSCSIVSTLIATVMFAAAFTVPGGNNSESGVPIFLQTNAFLVFAISDALALLSSLTSVLMFLSILTARYAEEDFLESLPKRLIIGLASLFLAITAMMIAFGATLSIVLDERLKWISIPTVLLSSVPVAIFILLQLPLFIQMIRSTFGFTFRPQNPW